MKTTQFTIPSSYRQFFKFVGVGGVSAIVHYTTLIGLVSELGVSAVRASALGALFGALINYILNHRFTFCSAKRHHEAFTKFSLIAVVGLLLNTLLMWVAVDIIRVHYLLGQIITTLLVMIWSFTGNRCWTFREGLNE